MGLDIYFNKKKCSEIGYFRKVNFLVKFFKNKGFDVENQTPMVISKEDAEELKSLCNKVLKDHSKAKELLPTMDGFFFGSVDYDNLYFKNVESVKIWIEKTLLPKFNGLEDGEYIEFSTWY